MHEQLSRREVIKTLLVASATSLLGNKVWAAKTVSEVTVNAINPSIGIARLQLSSFPALNNNGGSVRLGSSSISGSFPRGLFFPIVINRVSATEYVALDSQCTHEGCVVNAFSGSVATGRITCPCHGSQFDIRGAVRAGPASFPLLSYPTSVAGGILTITLPDPYGFTVEQTTILNGSEKRLKLSWTSFDQVEYEVRHRPDLNTEAVRVNFSITESGPLSSTFITGNDNTRSAYVVPQDGIYQVAIRMRAV